MRSTDDVYKRLPERLLSARHASFSLQQFSLSDVEHIHLLEIEASTSPWSEADFTSSIESGHLCIGLKIMGRWCAHAVFSILLHDEVELLVVAVAPQYSRQGLGRALLRSVLSILGEVDVFLEVRESNVRALGLYQGLGFQQVGLRKNYYPPVRSDSPRENAVVMKLDMRMSEAD